MGRNVRCLNREDLSSVQKILNIISSSSDSDNIFINAAGYAGKPNVDSAETEKEECFEGNVLLPLRINKACSVLSIPLLHISTGCIYTGHEEKWREEDPPNFDFLNCNGSFYSGTKALAEELLLKNPNVWIFRIRMPFCNDLQNPRNFIHKIIKYPKLIETTNSATNLDELALIIYQCYFKRFPFGIYNIVNEGEVKTSKLLSLLEKYGYVEANSKTWFKNINEFLKSVKCPRSECVLSTNKLKKLGLQMSDVNQKIEEILIKNLKSRN